MTAATMSSQRAKPSTTDDSIPSMNAKSKAVFVQMTIMAVLSLFVLALHFSISRSHDLNDAASDATFDAVDSEIDLDASELRMDEAEIRVLNNMTEGESHDMI